MQHTCYVSPHGHGKETNQWHTGAVLGEGCLSPTLDHLRLPPMLLPNVLFAEQPSPKRLLALPTRLMSCHSLFMPC